MGMLQTGHSGGIVEISMKGALSIVSVTTGIGSSESEELSTVCAAEEVTSVGA